MFIASSLQDLLYVVPQCQPAVTLGELWLMFCQNQCHCIVVVDRHEHPQGLVFLPRLIHYLFSAFPEIQLSNTETNSLGLQQTLDSQKDHLIEPIPILSVDAEFSQFREHLQQLQQSQSHTLKTIPTLAMVNPDGQFLGLVDTLALLQSVTETPSTPPSTTHGPLTQTVAPFLQNLLEQMPIPLMVQTIDGNIILQNWAWQSRLHTGAENIRQTAETVIHFSSTTSSEHLSSINSPQTDILPSWCQLGPTPDTYICVCSTAEEEESVWQFTRQPLQSQWSELLTPPSQSQPSPQLWLVLAQEITEQHRVSQELASKNADLVHLNRLKDEFLACISHELKTPLTAILGLSKLLNEPLLGSLNERQAHYAQLIYQSGRHLMMVVNDILDLTRIETEQLELSLSVIQIEAVCEQGFTMAAQQQQQQNRSKTYQSLAEATEHQIAEARTRFTLEIDPDLDFLVGDELRLRQMLAHLLSNALKFTPQNQRLGLRVSLWDQWVAFTVWDEGIGIPEDKQHLIFQKFQQLQNPLTREYQGTGLGLVLTQRLAHLHGGDVSFISQAGVGSQFTILLPPSPPMADVQLSSKLPQIQYRSKSTAKPRLILIVEAVPRFIQHISEHLNQIGYQVVIARSGTEAIEKARCLQPHVIFLNPLLPLLSGWDVLTLLKTDGQTHQIPVVITATLGDKNRALKNRSDGFLCLPVEPSELQRTLAILNQKPLQKVTQKLTILWLNPIDEQKKPEVQDHNSAETAAQDSALILQNCTPCRIIEADDLVQAELLARIWQPNVVVLESLSGVQSPSNFLQQFTQEESLSTLPLITLDSFTTELANKINSLLVFPCLISNLKPESDAAIESALLQAVQLATGMNRKGSILVIDLLTLSQSSENNFSTTIEFQTQMDHALIQYLETAGFRSIMGNSWREVIQLIQSQTIDLLLICSQSCMYSSLHQGLEEIEAVNLPLPIFIWDRSDGQRSINSTFASQQTVGKSHPSTRTAQVSTQLSAEIQQLIDRLRIQVLPSHTSIVEVLNTVRQYFQVH
jgi:signal transduction histidine kinase/ActR/RegA family two-component response regulator